MSSENQTRQSGRVRLSVLDLVHVRSGQTSADAVTVSIELARSAERLGYSRYWVAEHHNMAATAATDPLLLVAILASATDRIRVGSGAVLLPNHAPLALAEQGALLEAAFPGRIDLGVGRAAGTDPLTGHLLSGGTDSVDTLSALLDPGGARVSAGGREHGIRATPNAASTPPIWVLGASQGSAAAAGERGLPYVFGHHLGVGGTAAALTAYRTAFRPSPGLATARTLLPVRASVADTYEEAYRAALPWLLVLLGLRTGRPQTAVPTIEEAGKTTLSATEREMLNRLTAGFVIGDPGQAAAHLRELAAVHDVDEIMIHPVAGAHEGEEPRSSPGQAATLQLLAEEVGRW
jgi:luciferase family oxidoreductase group 1